MSYTIWEIPDGGLDYPRESLLPNDASADLVAAYPPVVAVPYRPLIVKTGSMFVLLDTGAGPLGPGTGRLQQSLRAQHIAAEEISLVVLSHAHADHIGGLLDAQGRRAFPNARIIIPQKEFEFWRTSGVRERLGTGSVYGNPMMESIIGEWLDRYLFALEPQLELVASDTELAPGIKMVPAPGHTPGHSAILVGEGEDRLLFTADAFTLPEHIEHVEWTSSFDLDPPELARTRLRLLDFAATEGCRVIHYHVGSIGHVVRRGTGYEWQPEQPEPSRTPTAVEASS